MYLVSLYLLRSSKTLHNSIGILFVGIGLVCVRCVSQSRPNNECVSIWFPTFNAMFSMFVSCIFLELIVFIALRDTHADDSSTENCQNIVNGRVLHCPHCTCRLKLDLLCISLDCISIQKKWAEKYQLENISGYVIQSNKQRIDLHCKLFRNQTN